MPLGLPTHLAKRTTGAAVAYAAHAIAGVSLVAVMVIGITIELSVPHVALWPALLALAPLAVLLVMLDRTPSWFIAACYLIIGALGIYLCMLVVSTATGASIANDDYPVQLVKIALVMVGGVSSSTWNAIGWTTAGYLAGEAATIAALTTVGAVWRLDAASLAIYLAVVGILVIIGADRFAVRQSQSILFRAARDEQLAEVRAVFESRATALLHDTILNQLAVVAATPGDRLAPAAQQTIQADLAMIVGEEWFTVDGAPQPDESRSPRRDLLRRDIDEAAGDLAVSVTGDLGAFDDLDEEAYEELARAIVQSITNVRRHAQTAEAEVIVGGAPDEVSVMVIDSGVGFDQDARRLGRLGVGASIVARLETVGGAASVWSQPGRGTSVLLRVPTEGVSA